MRTSIDIWHHDVPDARFDAIQATATRMGVHYAKTVHLTGDIDEHWFSVRRVPEDDDSELP